MAQSLGVQKMWGSICRGNYTISLANCACLVTFFFYKTAVQAASWDWKIQWWLEGLFSKSRKMHWEWIIFLDTEGCVRKNGVSHRQVEQKPKMMVALRDIFKLCTGTFSVLPHISKFRVFQIALSYNSIEGSTEW
jgi:hypothetical protein